MRRPYSICEFQERSRPYVVIPLHGGGGGDNLWAFITITMPRKRSLFLGCRRRTSAMQQRIGSMLRERYEPPKDLPHELLALLVKLNNQDDDN
jgi:hypothetical protein